MDAPHPITLAGERVTLELLSKTQAVEGRPYGPRLLPDGDSVLFEGGKR
jgi:hypothetical protein